VGRDEGPIPGPLSHSPRRLAGRTAARRLLGAALVAALVVAGFAVFSLSRSAEVGSGSGVDAMVLTDFDGEEFSLRDYGGSPVVVNFWASWCPSCIAEMPAFEKVHQDIGDEVAFLGIDQRDSRGPAEALAKETGVTYRLAEDPNGRLFDAFGGVGMPTTVFISAEGTVAEVVVGQLTESQLRSLIATTLGVSSDA
jgi:cytochrome c biogenesis protein CcmG, thiol:disulfide interchange protein DsbE